MYHVATVQHHSSVAAVVQHSSYAVLHAMVVHDHSKQAQHGYSSQYMQCTIYDGTLHVLTVATVQHCLPVA